MKLSREAQVVVVGAALYVILSFFHWQAFGPFGLNEWHGLGGVVTALVGVALLAWEVGRLVDYKVSLGGLPTGLVSLLLALALLVLTVITFLSHNEFRAWPAWVALIVSLAIAAAAVKRGQSEGFEVKDIQKHVSARTSSSGPAATPGGPTPPSEPPAAPDPPPPA